MAGTDIATALNTSIGDYVNGASNEAALTLRASIAILQDFCRWVHPWKETLTAIDSVAETQSYTLTPGTTYSDYPEIIGLDGCKYKPSGADDSQFYDLDLKSREWLDVYDKSWVHRESSPQPYRCFWNELDGKLYLIDKPSVASTGGLLPRVILMPAENATTAPPFLFTKYKKALVFGIAGDMLRMANQRWSNAEMGDYYHSLYIAERDNAQLEVDRGSAKLEDYHVIPERAFTGGSRNSFRAYGGVFDNG